MKARTPLIPAESCSPGAPRQYTIQEVQAVFASWAETREQWVEIIEAALPWFRVPLEDRLAVADSILKLVPYERPPADPAVAREDARAIIRKALTED